MDTPTPTQFVHNQTALALVFDNQTTVSMAWGNLTQCVKGQSVEVLVGKQPNPWENAEVHGYCSPHDVAKIIAKAAGIVEKTPDEARALRDMWICSGLITHVLLLAKENGTISENSFKACVDAVRLAAKAGDPLPS